MLLKEINTSDSKETSIMAPRLQVTDLSVSLVRQPDNLLLKNVSLALHAGEIYALVGESGSGKSITSLSIMRLLPDALTITSGNVLLKGKSLFHLTEQDMSAVRGSKVAMIFQDALTSLNPVKKIGHQITETLKIHTRLQGRGLQERAIELLAEVGIPDPEKRLDCYPHQMSGGQQQRVMIAIALACNPDVLLADEPTTALDVTIQKQILKLLKNQQPTPILPPKMLMKPPPQLKKIQMLLRNLRLVKRLKKRN